MNKLTITVPVLMLGGALLAAACTASVSPAVTVVCTADDGACSSDAECCSYLCAADGYCGLPAGGCLEDNSDCSSDAECCSGICASDGYCGLP